MDEYIQSNRNLWNRWTGLHEKSELYDLAHFKADGSRLRHIEKEQLGDVSGKSLLHLQCHFGLDTLSWAGLGATVTGADISDESIALARSLSSRLGLPATFVRSNLYDLPQNLSGQFDIVYTSYGVLWWLPDLEGWARVVAHFLKPGGTFLVVDAHPAAMIFDPDNQTELKVAYPYFPRPEPLSFKVQGSYAAADPDYEGVEYGWMHSLSECVNALIAAGLQIESLQEFPYIFWKFLPFLEKAEHNSWTLPAEMGEIPLLFSIRATRKG